jgi:hypothetical protein
MKQQDRLIGEVVERLTPVILKKYDGKEFCPNPHLDAVALAELKREALRLLAAGEKQQAETVLSFIKQKPKFAICDGTWDVLWFSPILASLDAEEKGIKIKAKDKFPDVLLFTSPGAKEKFMERYNEVVQRTLKDKNKADTMS